MEKDLILESRPMASRVELSELKQFLKDANGDIKELYRLVNKKDADDGDIDGFIRSLRNRAKKEEDSEFSQECEKYGVFLNKKRKPRVLKQVGQIEQEYQKKEEGKTDKDAKWINQVELNKKLDSKKAGNEKGGLFTGVEVADELYKNSNEAEGVKKENGVLKFDKSKNPKIYLRCKRKGLHNKSGANGYKNINIDKDDNIDNSEKSAPRLLTLLNLIRKRKAEQEKFDKLSEKEKESLSNSEIKKIKNDAYYSWCRSCSNREDNSSTPRYEIDFINDLSHNLNRFLRNNNLGMVQKHFCGSEKLKDKDNVEYDGYIVLNKKIPILTSDGDILANEIKIQLDGTSSHQVGSPVMKNDFGRIFKTDKENGVVYIAFPTRAPQKQIGTTELKGEREAEYAWRLNKANETLRNLFGKPRYRISSVEAGRMQNAENKKRERNSIILNSTFNSLLEKLIAQTKDYPNVYKYTRINKDGSKTTVFLKDFLITDEGKKTVRDNADEWGKLAAIPEWEVPKIKEWINNHRAEVGTINYRDKIYPTSKNKEIRKLFEEIKKRTSK